MIKENLAGPSGCYEVGNMDVGMGGWTESDDLLSAKAWIGC